MKVFSFTSINYQPSAGLCLGDTVEESSSIILGEEGRGRSMAVITVDPTAVEAQRTDGTLGVPRRTYYYLQDRVSILKRGNDLRLTAETQAGKNDRRALLFVLLHPVHRGSVELLGSDGEYPCRQRGKWIGIIGGCWGCGIRPVRGGWHQDDEGVEHRNSDVLAGEDKLIEVLAHGVAAKGAAGRVGSSIQAALIMRPGAELKVIAASTATLVYDGETLVYKKEE